MATYAKLVDDVLEIGIHQKGVNMTFEGDLYQLNNMQTAQYPIFVSAPTEPQLETKNYYEARLTLYYIDRLQYSANEYHNPDHTLIYSAGMQVLSNIIKKISLLDYVIDIDENIEYICWGDTQIFADKCAGVYTTVKIKYQKESICATE